MRRADGAGDDVAFLHGGVAALLLRRGPALRERRGDRRLHLSSVTSSLVMRQVISVPTSFSSSAASRVPLRLAGMKARTPTSTLRPPLIDFGDGADDGESSQRMQLRGRSSRVAALL